MYNFIGKRKVVNCIPGLVKVVNCHLTFVVFITIGVVYFIGDANKHFFVQLISKVLNFIYAIIRFKRMNFGTGLKELSRFSFDFCFQRIVKVCDVERFIN